MLKKLLRRRRLPRQRKLSRKRFLNLRMRQRFKKRKTRRLIAMRRVEWSLMDKRTVQRQIKTEKKGKRN